MCGCEKFTTKNYKFKNEVASTVGGLMVAWNSIRNSYNSICVSWSSLCFLGNTLLYHLLRQVVRSILLLVSSLIFLI